MPGTDSSMSRMDSAGRGRRGTGRRAGGHDRARDDPVSAVVKLGCFLLLLVAVCAGAYAAGARVGPVAPGPSSTATPSGGTHMGEVPWARGGARGGRSWSWAG